MSAEEYEVGYGKPPRHAQFRRGNPGGPGRPRRSSLSRHLRAILEEERAGVTVGEALVRIATQRTLEEITDDELKDMRERLWAALEVGAGDGDTND